MKKSNVFLGLFLVVLTVVLLGLGSDALASNGHGVFTITVQNELGTSLSGATFNFNCGGTVTAAVRDGSASDSSTLPGTISVVASTKDWFAATDRAKCTGTNAFTVASVSFDSVSSRGYINRGIGSGLTMSPSATAFVATATMSATVAMPFSVKVTTFQNELGTALALDGTTASASVLGQTTTYSGSAYVPATGTAAVELRGGAHGYVNVKQYVTPNFKSQQTFTYLTVNRLPYAYKFTLAPTTVTGGSITAGNSAAIGCVDGGSNLFYCPVPHSHTAITAYGITSTAQGYDNNTLTYSLRASDAASQSTGTLTLLATGGGTGGSTGGYQTTPVVVNNPTPMPSVSVTPTPTPAYTAGPATPAPVSGVTLLRALNSPRVYVLKDGKLQWVKTLQDFNNNGYKWSDVKNVTPAQLIQSGTMSYKVVSTVKYLNVRDQASTKGKIVSKLNPGELVNAITGKNGWSQITLSSGQTAWVYSLYLIQQ
jgi:hypothetical protein